MTIKGKWRCADTRLFDVYPLLTGGILEACNQKEEEFGLARVRRLIDEDAHGSLRSLAEKIFAAVDAFGRQVDDQTLLMIRVR